MSTFSILMIAVIVAQIPLLVVAALLEFSRRKARAPVASRRFAAAPPEASDSSSISASPSPASTVNDRAETVLEVGETPLTLGPIEGALPDQVGDGAPVEQALAVEAIPPPTVDQVPAAASAKPPARIGLGLRRTRENFLTRIRAAITGSAKLDDIYEGLEEALISADVGLETSLKIIQQVRAQLKSDARPEIIRDALKDEIERILLAVERPFADSGEAPLVIIMVGVNGVGKTTTVAKLAALFKEQGSVIVAAADTFRAAAIEQLEVWCARAGVDLIKQKAGSDPAAVAFDAVKAAIARCASAVIIDTAGRLQTKVNLMEELKKIGRVVGRELPGAPHETWLVLDATTGQNALSQAKVFGETTPLTGVVLAKLDGTAKGGVVVAIADRLQLPVRFVGLGEELEDLRPFDAHEFVNALFADAEDGRETRIRPYAA